MMNCCCVCLAMLTCFIISTKCDLEDQSLNPIGVDYGTHGSNLLAPARVVELLQGTNIGKVRLYDANPSVLRAFAGTSFEITVGVSNDQIPGLVDRNAADSWVKQNVVAYLPATRIRTISVGTEVLTSKNQQLASLLLPAMKSLYSALVDQRLDSLIKVTTPNSLSILSTSFPPSSGTFRPELVQTAIVPMLNFLSNTNSTFMVNAYPYIAFRNNPRDISLAYCLFLPNAGVTDPGSGIVYSNMFGAMLDAVISAMNKVHFPELRIGVSETGWPSLGEPNEAGVSATNAMTYNRNLVYYISSKPGTPLRPKQQIDTYIFSLFNENLKEGPASERNFGLFRPDGSVVYDVGILKSGSVISPPVTNPPTTPGTPVTNPPTTPGTAPSPPVTNPPTRPPPTIVPVPITPPPGTNPPSPPPTATKPPPPPLIIPVPRPPPSPTASPPPAPVSRPPSPIPVTPVTPPSPVIRPSPPPTPVTYPAPAVPSPPVTNPSPPVTTPSPPANSPPYAGTPVRNPGYGVGAPVWCVAKPNADMGALTRALNYACGEGGADCSAIQPGGPCFYPNEIASHASYAFNSYYQNHGRNYWNCDFTNNAVVAISDPSYGSCNYPAK